MVDYKFYKETFLGDIIPEALFKKFEIKSSNFINEITFKRIDLNNITENIKMAVCAVAEKMFNIENEGGIKTSETVSKHSVSFFIPQNISIERLLYKEASLYLPKELLYRGV